MQDERTPVLQRHRLRTELNDLIPHAERQAAVFGMTDALRPAGLLFAMSAITEISPRPADGFPEQSPVGADLILTPTSTCSAACF